MLQQVGTSRYVWPLGTPPDTIIDWYEQRLLTGRNISTITSGEILVMGGGSLLHHQHIESQDFNDIVRPQLRTVLTPFAAQYELTTTLVNYGAVMYSVVEDMANKARAGRIRQ
ncbi:hypothetical protein HC891_26595 [Candidatus Gracilibacteria bacterium]|nr:hypothetical protein [Candidatus Gracilibacteria bacterium]